MNSNRVYSSSLKRMLGFKYFPTINPESIVIQSEIKNTERLADITIQKKTDKQISEFKRQLIQNKQQQKGLQKQIDAIVQKMIDQGGAQLSMRKVKKRKESPSNLRIVTQPDENEKKKDQSIRLPEINHAGSTKKLKSFRLKTEAIIGTGQEIIRDQPSNAQNYIKHYRAGMSSLKKLKIKPLN